MRFLLGCILSLIICSQPLFANRPAKVAYELTKDPIDVVIPCIEKDLETLELCIRSIRKYVKNVRRIVIVSDKLFTSSAEWFDEKLYPFTKFDVAFAIFGNKEGAEAFVKAPHSRVGWIFQQFLKLYAPFVIPGISSNVLVVDADVVFLRPIQFLGKSGEPIFTLSNYRQYMPYVKHAKRLIPWLTPAFEKRSGIAHHMLLQKAILTDLFKTIEQYHHDDAWKCMCRCIDKKEVYASSLSEYEIYFNFAFIKTKQARLRKLKWLDSEFINKRKNFKQQGYDYVAFHAYKRGKCLDGIFLDSHLLSRNRVCKDRIFRE